jgi:alkylhydroperoxidase family enzyme
MLGTDEVSDPTVARVYGEIEGELGFGIVPNLFKAMGSNPAVLESNWRLFRSTVLVGHLPRALKEMVGVVVSTVHDSRYARLVHLHSLSVQGVSSEVLRALSEGSVEPEGLAPTVVACLRFAQSAARKPGGVSAADFGALTAVDLSPPEILELLATIQLFTAVNLFTDVADVEVDQI